MNKNKEKVDNGRVNEPSVTYLYSNKNMFE